MYISLNWIREFVDLDGVDIKDLTNKFTLSTAEIEEVNKEGTNINNVVVGKITHIKKHPKSEKLNILKVDIGSEEVQSVCGAPNVKEGLIIAFAKIGASTKKIPKVEKTLIENFESNGVCCSALELGIGDDHTGLLVIEENCELGTDIKVLWGIEDTIIEIDNKSLTHRPDLWGHFGIAREIAAITGRNLKPLQIDSMLNNDLEKLNVKVEDTTNCFRYSSIGIDNINKKISPMKMQVRLFYCGMRPISLLVDLTNYIMLELGQPMHAFDKKLVNNIIVKSTSKPIKFTTLDDIERNIPKNTLMICDSKSEIAIAGIMGGKTSEVNDDTTTILLESANFDAPKIRRSATEMNLRTEASSRFEKSLDPEITSLAIERFCFLLKTIDENVIISSCLTDIYSKKYEKLSLSIEKSYIEKYMGQKIDTETILKILNSLEFGVEENNNKLIINIPSFRATKDISIKADIVEEIARIYGYDNIELKSTNVTIEPLIYNDNRILEHKIKELLSENYGLSEVHSYIWENDSFNKEVGLGKKDGLKIINSSNENHEILRQYIATSMIYFAEVNKNNFDEYGFFEIGSAFPKDNKEFKEFKKLGLLLASKKTSEENLFYEAKGVINSLFKIAKNIEPEYLKISENQSWINASKAATIKVDDSDYGYISVLHPMIKEKIDKKLNIVLLEINISKIYELPRKVVKFIEPSKYPEVEFDLNLLVSKLEFYEEVYRKLVNFNYKELNEDIDIYKCDFVNIYEGKGLPEGKKSLTFNFVIGSRKKTLSSEEIQNFRNVVINYIEQNGYKLR